MRKDIIWIVCFFSLIFAVENAQAAPDGPMSAPDFSLRNIHTDMQTTLSSFRGQVVLIDFFATWCQPCAITIPILREVNAAYSSSFQLISIDVQWNGGEDDATVLNFIEDRGMNWIVLKDTADSATGAAYGVSGIPTFFLIDKTGDLRRSHQGASITVDLLTSEISDLLQEEQAPPLNSGNPQNSPQSSEDTNTAEEKMIREFLQDFSSVGLLLQSWVPQALEYSLFGDLARDHPPRIIWKHSFQRKERYLRRFRRN